MASVDAEPGQLPSLVQIVPLALCTDTLQVGVVSVTTQRRNDLLQYRLEPLQRLRLLADCVQVVDAVQLELRLNVRRSHSSVEACVQSEMN